MDRHGQPDEVGSADGIPVPGAADVRDPYPGLHAARERCPVHHLGPGRAVTGVDDGDLYVVYGHDAVVSTLRDAATFSSAIVAQTMGPVLGRSMVTMDGDQHRDTRQLVAQAFRPRVLQRWQDTLIEPLVHELIDEFCGDGRAELVRQFNFRFPVRVIAAMLGLPESDLARFQRWSVDIIGYGADRRAGVAASQELSAYLRPLIAERRATPRQDLVSELVTAEVDGQHLSDDDIIPFLLILLPAGAETTYRALGNLQLGLLQHPDQLDAVRDDRRLLPAAVDESLRWEPPLLMTFRRSTADCPVAGVAVPRGAQVGVMTGAANRDPQVWPDPDTFDVHREHHPHVTFGSGPHMCLGAHLARAEMRIAMEALFDRLPGLRLDDEADEPQIRGMLFRSPTRVPVRFMAV